MTGAHSGSFALPEGTVTFLLTDVEASTSTWEAEPAAMVQAITRHYDVLDAAIAAHGGVRPVEQGEGDSVVAAFSRASDAVRAALDAQRRLRQEAWPTTSPLAVRMAIHTGEAQLRDSGNYVGPAIIRTARLRAIGHGGQVLISAVTRDLVGDELGAGGVVDLGIHRLKDLARPEHVWQLAHPDLRSEFPPLRSLDRVPNNLPVSLSSFIGRADDISTVAGLIGQSQLVTLTGTGGAGKTRLAEQVAAEVADRYPDGAWWVDLVGVTDPSLVPAAIGRAVGVPDDPDDPLGGVARRLAAKEMLLVLDNCEHLIDGCAEVAAALLAAGPDVILLATSRVPLGVPGELSWRVPALAMPRPGGAPEPLGIVSAYDAVRLFVDRAVRARQDFRLTDANAATVAEICARVDGVPLAIELAAARCRVLAPGQIRDGLSDAIELLTGGPRVAAPRHQTIEASISWSHSLLDDAERVLFRRLAMFAAPFTLDAAETVPPDDALPAAQVLDLLAGLVDQSLLQMDDTGGDARYRMLETVRQFARRELATAGERDELADRHSSYFAARARSLWPLFHAGMARLLEIADAEYGDLVAMLAHLEEHGSPEEFADVAVACLPCLHVRHPLEAAAWGDRVLARLGDAPTVLSGRLHLQFAVVSSVRTRRHIDAAAAAAAATGDPEVSVGSGFLTEWRRAVADPTPDAVAAVGDGRRRLEEVGEDHISKFGLWSLAALKRAIGRDREAFEDWERAEASIVCGRCRVRVWTEAALLALDRGDRDAARAAADAAQAGAVDLRDAGYSGDAYLAATEVAIYAREPWPDTVIEEEFAVASSNAMAAGYLHEARAAGRFADGDLAGAERDLRVAIAELEGAEPAPTQARLRLAAVRHALDHEVAAAEVVAELRDAASRWNAGPVLTARIEHRAAALALDAGDLATAAHTSGRALADAATGPWPLDIVAVFELLASIAAAGERAEEAALLAGAATRLRDKHRYRLRLSPERERLARDLDTVRTHLGAAAFDAATSKGRALTLEQAAEYARR